MKGMLRTVASCSRFTYDTSEQITRAKDLLKRTGAEDIARTISTRFLLAVLGYASISGSGFLQSFLLDLAHIHACDGSMIGASRMGERRGVHQPKIDTSVLDRPEGPDE